MTVRRRMRIRGRVQGVGFRWFARSQARAFGLAGWVRNESDGSVHCEVQGPAADVDRFVAVLRRGPPGGRVADIDQEELAPDEGEGGFDIAR